MSLEEGEESLCSVFACITRDSNWITIRSQSSCASQKCCCILRLCVLKSETSLLTTILVLFLLILCSETGTRAAQERSVLTIPAQEVSTSVPRIKCCKKTCRNRPALKSYEKTYTRFLNFLRENEKKEAEKRKICSAVSEFNQSSLVENQSD